VLPAWLALTSADSALAAAASVQKTAVPAPTPAGQTTAAPEQLVIQHLIEAAASAPPASDHVDLGRLRALYVKRAFAPLWTQQGELTPQAGALLKALRTAGNHGLRASDYDADALAGLLKAAGTAPADRIASFDVRLSETAARFLVHLHQGRVDPKAASFELRSRAPLDLGALLSLMGGNNDVGDVVNSVEPAFNHYQLLLPVLGRYRELAAHPELTSLPRIKGTTVKPGQPYAGVPALRRLLRALGDLPSEAPKASLLAKGTRLVTVSAKAQAQSKAAPSLLLDPGLVKALKRFQLRHGLTPDGAIDRNTYAALTTPLAQRVRQIELTMERWRWLPPFETPPIIVNIPQFKLFAFRSTQDVKEHVRQMNVIVGQAFPEKQTPVFAADMRYLIFRPYWEIPRDILLDEVLPKLRQNPKFLTSDHLQIVQAEGASDADLSPLPPTPDNLDALEAGKLRLRQEPGPDNSLGLIKFMFPNSHDVYLHSTPAHQLFRATRRDLSHGCIRVSDPVALAVQVLRDTPGDWTLEKVQEAMKSGDNQRVNLAKPIRVYILYASAVANEDGTVFFFDDIYGHDHELETLLQLPAVVPPQAMTAPRAPARSRS
jgi:murein L,D-transpeptidase YcbB/YkuD